MFFSFLAILHSLLKNPSNDPYAIQPTSKRNHLFSTNLVLSYSPTCIANQVDTALPQFLQNVPASTILLQKVTITCEISALERDTRRFASSRGREASRTADFSRITWDTHHQLLSWSTCRSFQGNLPWNMTYSLTLSIATLRPAFLGALSTLSVGADPDDILTSSSRLFGLPETIWSISSIVHLLL